MMWSRCGLVYRPTWGGGRGGRRGRAGAAAAVAGCNGQVWQGDDDFMLASKCDNNKQIRVTIRIEGLSLLQSIPLTTADKTNSNTNVWGEGNYKTAKDD